MNLLPKARIWYDFLNFSYLAICIENNNESIFYKAMNHFLKLLEYFCRKEIQNGPDIKKRKP